MTLELLYLAWNRREFTETSFRTLALHTDWERVSRLVVYDDGSTDGTRELLEEAGAALPVPAFELRHGGFGSVGATMNDYVAQTHADAFVKVDNDIALPPDWLPALLAAAERHPEFELVGMEAGWNGRVRGEVGEHEVVPAQHIGGVGLMRAHAFSCRRPIPATLGHDRRACFTIWQHRHGVRAGWINPDLAVVQLDRIPEDPWATLAAHYVGQGWARAWSPYDPISRPWWEWLDDLPPA